MSGARRDHRATLSWAALLCLPLLSGCGYLIPAAVGTILGTQKDSSTPPPQVVLAAGISQVQVSAAQATADGQQQVGVTVTVSDVDGNPISDQVVQLQVSGVPNPIINQPAGPTNAIGVATGTVTASSVGAAQITAIVNPGPVQVVLTDQPMIVFVPGPPSSGGSSVTVDTNNLTAGAGTATITITVRDVSGNPIANRNVLLQVSGGGNSLTQPAGTTDAQGVVTGSLSSTVAQTKQITAIVDPGASQVVLNDRPTVNVGPAGLSASTSTVTANPTSGVVADGVAVSTITVVTRDGFGNPISGQTVAISATGAGNTVVQPGGPTGGGGIATGTLASTVAGAKTVTATVNGSVVLVQQPLVTFSSTGSGPSAGNSLVTALPTSLPADNATTTTITVTVRDGANLPIAGETVQIQVTGGGNTIVQPGGPTDLAGQVTATVRSSVAEAKTVTAIVNPGASQVVITDTEVLTFNPGAVSAGVSTVVANPTANVTADGAAQSTVTVTVRDALGNPIPGATVTLAASPVTGNTIGQPGAVTDMNGVATGTLATTTAETKTITATVNGATALTQMPTVGFVAGPVSPGTSTVVAPGPVVADGVATTTITIAVLDVNGNPVSGQAVQLAASGSGNVFVQPGPTNASGVTTGTLRSSVAEDKTITATVNPGPSQVVVTQQPTVTFTPGAVSAGGSLVVASPLGLVADGAAITTVTVTVRDPLGNPIPGQTVTLTATDTGSGNTLTQPVGTTDGAGQITGTLASTVAEGKTIVATVNGATVLTTQPLVTFNPGPVSPSASLVVAPGPVPADDATTTTITVTVRDGNNNPISGQAVLLSASGSNNVFVQPGNTNGAGVTSGTLRSSVAEIKTITVTINPGPSQVVLSTQPTVTFTPGAVDAGVSLVSAAPTSGLIADGAAISTITVTVRDVLGNPIPGQSVTLAAAPPGGNTLTQPVGVTDANGVAEGTLATTVAGAKTVTATVNGATVLTQTPTVTFQSAGGGVSAGNSTVLAPGPVPADDATTTTITVTVLDGGSLPLAGETVQILVSGTGNTVVQPGGPTNGSGVATGTVRSSVAEIKTVTVIVNPGAGQVVLTAQPTITFTPGAVSAGSSLVAVSPAALVADGAAITTVTVTVRDPLGNPISGQTVTLTATDTGSGNTLTQPVGTTNGAGQITGSLASTVAEAKTVVATVNGATVVTQQPVVTFNAGPVSPSASLVVAPGPVVANDAATTTITVTVLDVNGNPISGQAVQLAASGTGNTFVQPGNTNGSGVTSGTLRSSVAEIKTVTVTVNPGPSQVVLTAQPNVTFTPDVVSAGNSLVAVSPAALVADGAAITTITITVRDPLGNPIPGQTVTLTATDTGSGNTLTQPVGTTNGAGQITGALASTVAEAKTVVATVNGATVLTQQPVVTFSAGPISPSASLVAAPGPVLADDATTTTVTVTVLDANGNPISGQAVQLAATGTGETFVQPGNTNGAGVTSGTLRSSVAEIKTITVTVNPGPSQVVLSAQPTVTFTPGAVDAGVSLVSASPTTGMIADGAAVTTVTVTVRDPLGNPIPGQTVVLTASGSNNVFVQPGLTDPNGVATGSLATTTAEAKTITATVNGATALTTRPVVTFDPPPVSPSASLVAAPGPVVADDATTTTITVTVRAPGGAPLSGQIVSIAVSGTGNTIVPPGGPTNGAGVATGTLRSSVAEIKTVTITVNPGPSQVVLTAQPTVTFTPDVVSAGNSLVAVSPAALVADGAAITTVTVTVRDPLGNPISGQTVTLTATDTGSGNTLTQPVGTTNGAGQITGTLASTVAEAKTVVATVNGATVVTQQPVVTFSAGPVSPSASLVAAPGPVVADNAATTTITVTVLDVNGNPISGQAVQLAASGTGNTFVQPGNTNGSGVTSGTLRSSVAEIKTVTVTVNPGPSQVVLTAQPNVTFTPDVVSAGNSLVAVSPAALVADGAAITTITITVRDPLGNPIPGQTVTLTATDTGSGNTLTQPVGTTNGAGQITGSLASTVAEAKTVVATVNGATVLTQQPVVTFNAGPVSPSASLVVAPGPVLADDATTTTVTVTVLDANGNPISGQAVQLAATGTGETFVQPGNTNGAGVTSGTLRSSVAEIKTITVTVNPGPSQVVLSTQPNVTFTPGAVDAGVSSVVAAPSSLVADGAAITTITVTVKDALGNPIPGQSVSLGVAPVQSTALTQPGAVTDANGVATGTLSATGAEVKTITATVNGVTVLTQQPDVTFTPGPPSAGLSTVVAAPGTLVADLAEITTITVTVKDANGNPISGATVSLNATGTGNTLNQPSLVTDVAGITSGTLLSSVAEIKTITVTVNPGPSQVVLTTQVAVTFTAGPPADAPSTVAVSLASLKADGAAITTITVTVRDAQGNPVAGETVSLAVAPLPGAILTQPGGPTDANGVVTGTLASTVAEAKTVTATVDPGGTPLVLSQQPGVTFASVPVVAVSTVAIGGPKNILPNETNKVLVRFRFTESGGAAARLTALTVTGSGSGDESADVVLVKLWEDTDADGVGDVQIGTGTYLIDNGTVTFAGLSTVIPASGTFDFVVSYDTAGPGQVNVPANEEFVVTVAAGDAVLVEVADGAPVVPSGLPQSGPTWRADPAPDPALVLTQQVALSNGNVFPNETDVEIVQLRLTESTTAAAVDLTALTLSAAGNGEEDLDISLVKLWVDNAPLGTRGPEDTQIGVGTYFSDNGSVTFGGLTQTILAGGTLDLLVTYDMAGATQVTPGDTYRVTVTNGDVVADDGGTPVSVSGGPETGPTLSAVAPTLDLQAGANNPSGTVGAVNTTSGVVLMQVSLFPQGDAIQVTRLDIDASGTGNDATGVTAAQLYRDVNEDGLLDAGDVLIETLNTPFSSNDGTASFSPNQTIANVTTAHWLVVYDMAGGNTGGDTFTATITNAAAVGVNAPNLVSGGFPLSGATVQTSGAVLVTRDASSPTGRALAFSELNADVLLLRVAADASNATVTAVTLTARGNAPDNTSLLNGYLYVDDGDGVFEPGAGDGAPVVTVASPFATDDGQVTFNLGAGRTINAGTAERWWFAVDVAASGPAVADRSFRLVLASDADVSAGTAVVSGAQVRSDAFFTGVTTTLFGASVALTRNAAQNVVDAQAADLDRDGNPDYVLLLANGQISVRLGAGNGTFAAGPSGALFPAVGPSNPNRIAVGDVDRDGYPDVVAVYDLEIRVFLNDGAGATAGAFASDTSYAETGTQFESVVLVDYDRDGDLDVVAGDTAGFRIFGRKNDGSGSFTGTADTAAALNPVNLRVVDLDRDGVQDLVGGDTTVARWKGNGTFFTFSGINPTGGTSFQLALADFDRDGFRDVAAVHDNALLRTFRNDGATFSLTQIFGPSTIGAGQTGAADQVAGDWNGDGLPDLLIANPTQERLIARLGNGSLSIPLSAASIYDPTTNGRQPERIALADFNKDGDPDLVIGSTGRTEVAYLPGDGTTGSGLATLRTPAQVSWTQAPADAVLGDFNRDGHLDYAQVASVTSTVGVWLNDGFGTSFTQQADVTLAEVGKRVVVGDVNRDGKLDLVVTVPGGTGDRVQLFLGNGDGTFGTALDAALLGDNDPGAIALGDLDRDGDLDAVVVEESSNTVQILRGNGTQLLAAVASPDQYATSTGPIDVKLADLNRDGILDLVVINNGSGQKRIASRLGVGDGTFGSLNNLSIGGTVGLPSVLALGDLNGDGVVDAVVGSSDTAVFLPLQGNGDGTFTAQTAITAPRATGIALGDMDKDGDLDVVLSSDNPSGVVSVFPNTGTFTFGAASSQSAASSGLPRGLVLGDLNQDGDLDVLAPASTSNDAQLFFGN